MLKIALLSLFPELVLQAAQHSILGRALEQEQVLLYPFQIRDFAHNRYGKVDDSLYGGGTGLLMQCQPIWEAWQKARYTLGQRARTLYLSPRGRRLDQGLVNELAAEEALILLCGHYEGIDERVLDEIEAEQISIGDYVLTGGELPAAVLIDALARQQEGVLKNSEAWQEESHYHGTLEARNFTKPPVWRNREVPSILRSGHHAEVEKWRKIDGWLQTFWRRPDLFAQLQLSSEDKEAIMAHATETGQEMDSLRALTPYVHSPYHLSEKMSDDRSLKAIRLVVFDLDGTLVDSIPHIIDSFHHCFESLKLPCPEDEALLASIGLPLETYLKTCVPEDQLEQALSVYRNYNETHTQASLAMFIGAYHLLEGLKNLGIPCAVLTSKRRLAMELSLATFGIEPYFVFCRGSEDSQKHKPDPGPLEEALASWNQVCQAQGEPTLTPEELLYVGDATYDILAAQAFGALSAVVAWTRMPHRDLQALGPDIWLEHLDQLLPFLAKNS